MLAAVAGIIAGSIVNMTVIGLGPMVIPPPEGVDVTDAESLKNSIHLFEARHFLMPFLAHAVGTLVGASVACAIATTGKVRMAYAVAVFFLAGGVVASFMIPAPAWFIGADLLLAYIPMAWLATRLWNPVTPG